MQNTICLAGCGQSTGTIELDGANPDKWHSKGCFEKVSMWFVERLHLVGAVGLVIAFLQVKMMMQPDGTFFVYFQTAHTASSSRVLECMPFYLIMDICGIF